MERDQPLKLLFVLTEITQLGRVDFHLEGKAFLLFSFKFQVLCLKRIVYLEMCVIFLKLFFFLIALTQQQHLAFHQ